MSLPPSKTTKTLFCLGVAALFVLLIILMSLLVIGLLSGHLSRLFLETGIICSMALFFLFTRIRKLREKRRNGRQLAWYTQPGILLALADLLLIPDVIIISSKTPFTSLNGDVIIVTLLIPSTVLILASAFFLIQWFRNPFPV